ncbi:MAG: DUF4906 domain-containing protein [Bacteroidales bacterium]|nr:DUF4906 domain-containing protein [Bacteroidales bacterium]
MKRNLLLFLALLCTLPACERMAPEPSGTMPDTPTAWSIRTDRETTKAYTLSSLESAAKGFRFALYDSETGHLLYTGQSNDSDVFEPPVDLLRSGRRYHWYFLAGGIAHTDGGRVTPEFPEQAADVPGMVYTCPDLAESQRQYGLDKAGCLPEMTPEEADRQDGYEDGIVTIPLECLWSKVSLRLDPSCISAMDIALSGVTAGPGCQVFRPFDPAGSRAGSVSDMGSILSPETLTDNQRNGLEPIVLYFPENRLGRLLPDNRDPYAKTPEVVEAASSGKGGLLNCLTLSCDISSAYGVHGDGVYRICLGEDNIRDFSLIRNTCYNLTVHPTEDGLYLDVWKSDFTLEDTRSLSVEGVRGYRLDGMYGPELSTGSSVLAERGKTCYAFVRYAHDGGTGADYTCAQYGASQGWDITSESRQALADAGISVTLEKRIPFITYSGGLNIWDESTYGTLANSSATYSGVVPYGSSWEAYLLLSAGVDLPENRMIPVTVQTFDGKHQAALTVHTSSLGDLVLEGLENTCYVGQKGSLRATQLPTGYTKARFTVPAASAGRLLVSPLDDRSCSVSLIGSGMGEVNVALWNGNTWVSTDPLTGKPYKTAISILAPVLKASPAEVELYADGTPVPFTTDYYTSDNRLLPVTSGSAPGGLALDPALYATYLAPTFTFSNTLGEFLNPGTGTATGLTSLSVQRLTSRANGSSIEPYYGTLQPATVTVRARNCSAVQPAHIGVRVLIPFEGLGEETFFGIVTNHSLDRFQYTFKVAPQSVLVGETLPGPAFTGVAPQQVTLSAADCDLAFSLAENGRLTTTARSTGTPAAGRYPLQATLTNRVSGESLTRSVGYVECYLPGCLHATAKAPMEDGWIYNPAVFGSYVRRKAAGIRAGISVEGQGGTASEGMQRLRTALWNTAFLDFTGLPERFSNAWRYDAAYNPDYAQNWYMTATPVYVDLNYALTPGGTPMDPLSDPVAILDKTETINDMSTLMVRSFSSKFQPQADPRPQYHAVWCLHPGTAILQRWQDMKDEDPARFPDNNACFRHENQPSVRIEPGALDGQLPSRDSGGYRFYYLDSETTGSLGIPYYLLAAGLSGNPDPCLWTSIDIQGF